ncbi:LysM peptidoglycan-binding domain-containing protein [Paenibacillus alkalitolerans]|uniref:LysM peptidoglycan-binding domain-containing protein n=1 Tax=Paenibacillus alkalitolerans TaxID=2799335 RepID=UPI0018F44D3A|nr:LysM peptidoglycan-binding domain-containing protein [Paenibacillus alkalitolerans]
MDFYLTSIKQNQRLQLPMNPKEITANTGARVISFETIALGEISKPKGKKAARIPLEGIFPGASRQSLGITKDWKEPRYYVDILQKWRDNGEQLRLLVTETPLNLDVFIDTFDHTYTGGHGDISYRIDLVQDIPLRIYTVQEAQQQTASSPKSSRMTPEPPRTYTVRSGDTLWTIAKKTLQDGSRWKEIYNANKALIGPNPDTIVPGQSLRIPGGVAG